MGVLKMPKRLGWQRILIGILLLLNALPFSGGREIRLEFGAVFIVAGWGLALMAHSGKCLFGS